MRHEPILSRHDHGASGGQARQRLGQGLEEPLRGLLLGNVATVGDGDQFRLTGDLLSQWLVRQTRRKAREGARSLDRWVEVWEKTSRLFERADAVNLSRKQVLLDVFLGLQTAARNTGS